MRISPVFAGVLGMSLTAGFVCLAVCMLRLLLKKAPKIFSYGLWAVVFFRFACPFAWDSPVSVIPQWDAWWGAVQEKEETALPFAAADSEGLSVGEDIRPGDMAAEGQNGETVLVNGTVAGDRGEENQPAKRKTEGLLSGTENGMYRVLYQIAYSPVLCGIWLCVMVLLVLCQMARGRRFQKGLGPVTALDREVCEAQGIGAPFVMGILRPRIYLPQGLCEERRDFILLHERTHIRRRDYLIKPLAFGIVCIHWFNPLAWVAWRLMCEDMEMSCDEAVLNRLHGRARREYAQALLAFAGTATGSYPSFGEPYAKKRIRNVLSYRRPAYRMVLVLTAVCLAASGCLATNPLEEIERENEEQREETPEENKESDGEEDRGEDAYRQAWEKYRDSYRIGSESPVITEDSVIWEADLTHDGTNERIVLDWGYFDTATWATFAVLDSEGKVIYTEEPAAAHMGWVNLYLCHREGRDYIFRYTPYGGQGYGSYSYELYRFNGSGEKVVEDSGEISFDMAYDPESPLEETKEALDISAMAEFAGRVNSYINDSFLIISTDQDTIGETLQGSGADLFKAGTPESPGRMPERYAILLKEEAPDEADRESLFESLRRWCESRDIPYRE